MDALSPYLFSEIQTYLSIKEAFATLSLLNKASKLIALSLYCLNNYMKRLLDLEDLKLDSLSSFVAIVTAMKLPESTDSLSIKGVGTNGGVYLNKMQYWVDNLFAKKSEGYSSRFDVANVNIAGVLSRCTVEYEIESTAELWLEVAKAGGKKALRAGSDTLRLESLLNQKAAPLRRKNSLGARLRRKIVDDVLPFESLQKFPGNDFVLVDQSLTVPVRNYTSWVKQIRVVRDNRFTCPVAAFMVFFSHEYIDVEHDDLNVYNNIDSLTRLDQFAGSTPSFPRMLPAKQDLEYVCREFAPCSAKLKPVIWGQFLSRWPKPLVYSLVYPRAATYFYLKLISPDDLRYEAPYMNEPLNIDCTFMWFHGNYLKLKHGKL